MKKIVLLLIIITSTLLSLKGQQTIFVRSDSVPIYEIVHDDLKNVLDSFITNEKKQKYFNDSIVFRIGTLDIYGNSIEISQPIGNSFYVKDNFETFGLLFYNGFLFHIEGRSIISEKILKKTRSKQKTMMVDLNFNIDYDEIFFGEYYRVTTWIYCLVDNKLLKVYNSNDYE